MTSLSSSSLAPTPAPTSLMYCYPLRSLCKMLSNFVMVLFNPYISWPSPISQSIFQFHQLSGMNYGVLFQISWVGIPLFSEGTIYVLMALYPESAVCSCLQHQTYIPNNLFAVSAKVCCCIAPSWIRRIKEVA